LVNNRITTLIGATTPATLDTLEEIVTYIEDTSSNLVTTMMDFDSFKNDTDSSFNKLKNGNLSVASAGSADKATSLFGGSAGVLPYQDASGSTKFTVVGVSGELLQSQGNSTPTWVKASNLSVASAGSAGSADKSTNLSGGSAGVLPYQDATDSTKFTVVGVSGELLQSQGNSTPTWVKASNLSVASAGSAGSADKSTNLSGGSAGLVPYQDATDSTKFTVVGLSGELLQSQGTGAPTWVKASNLSVASAGSADKSTNLSGGSAGLVPYQDATDSTKFTVVGLSGELLQSQGNSAPTWVSFSSLAAGKLNFYVGNTPNIGSPPYIRYDSDNNKVYLKPYDGVTEIVLYQPPPS
jgi:hypothetical protein